MGNTLNGIRGAAAALLGPFGMILDQSLPGGNKIGSNITDTSIWTSVIFGVMAVVAIVVLIVLYKLFK
jgi:hypothetical protein